MINEQLFQYIWQHSLFRPEGLKTTANEVVVINHPGRLNRNAGPDFLEGKVTIANTIWVGNVELHLKSSDWKRHKHHKDETYKNIILHVVLEDDEEDSLGNFPTLILKKHIPEEVLKRYEGLMSEKAKIPCHAQIHRFPTLKWQAWLNRLLAERWEEKLEEWEDLWKQTGKDWRQLLYYRMAANFGFHKNKVPFLALAQSLPLKVLARHRKNLKQIEALLFGQSGLLDADDKEDDYRHRLQKEYHYLRRKYELAPLPAYHWKFMRMRPANFPSIRLAQFAMLIHKSLDLFAKMMEVRSEKEVKKLFDLEAGDYWNNHYRFGETSKTKRSKRLGQAAIQNIIINTIAPMQFLYAQLQGATNLVERSTNLLQSLPAEKNSILRTWAKIDIKAKDAAESQALIQLYNRYCSEKRCLECAVGHFLIKGNRNNIGSN